MNEEEQKAMENLGKDLKGNIQEDNKIDNYKYVSNLYSNGDIEVVLNLISRLQKELDKKDKVIELMADEINSLFVGEKEGTIFLKNKEAIIDYYFKKVEEENAKN